MSLKDRIDAGNLPRHIAVIMDGNGRWAKKHGKPRVFGHRAGVKSVREVSEGCAEIGVRYLTLYAFSTENWGRPAYEINALMELLVKTIREEVKTLNENNIRLRTIGDTAALPVKAQQYLQEAIENTSGNTRMDLILALSYSSQWEILEATRKAASDIKEGKLNIDSLDKAAFEKYLCTSDIPDPELLIRTSGENRISNFLLWQIAYAELYFTETLWPDFDRESLYSAIIDFQMRERRFGKISEQIKPS